MQVEYWPLTGVIDSEGGQGRNVQPYAGHAVMWSFSTAASGKVRLQPGHWGSLLPKIRSASLLYAWRPNDTGVGGETMGTGGREGVEWAHQQKLFGRKGEGGRVCGDRRGCVGVGGTGCGE